MTRHVTTGQNNWVPRPPQTDARRLETEGPLNLQDDREISLGRVVGEAVLVMGLFGAAVLAAVGMGWL